MHTLHIENKVHDYETWKVAFDAYEQARKDRGVVAYRIYRHADDPHDVAIDLDFEARDDVAPFVEFLHAIWQTPRSQALLADHGTPKAYDVMEQRTF